MKKFLMPYYYVKQDGSSGFGNIFVDVKDNDVYTQDCIKLIEEQIRKGGKYNQVAVQNIIQMNG